MASAHAGWSYLVRDRRPVPNGPRTFGRYQTTLRATRRGGLYRRPPASLRAADGERGIAPRQPRHRRRASTCGDRGDLAVRIHARRRRGLSGTPRPRRTLALAELEVSIAKTDD